MKYKHLLVDGKNIIYRAVYAMLSSKAGFQPAHPVVIVLRFINNSIAKLKPKYIHWFWDSPRDKVWRVKEVDSKYKDRGNLDPSVMLNVYDTIKHWIFLSKFFGFCQYYNSTMEADDLIYAFCKLSGDQTVILSSDGDFKQIPYCFPNVHLYNPNIHTFENKPKINPPIVKCFAGDNSDKIRGYEKIGPIRALPLASIDKRSDFFNDLDKPKIKKGDDIITADDEEYWKNLLLIDMSLCPYLFNNIKYVERKFRRHKNKGQIFNVKKIIEYIRRHKIRRFEQELRKYKHNFQTTSK